MWMQIVGKKWGKKEVHHKITLWILLFRIFLYKLLLVVTLLFKLFI